MAYRRTTRWWPRPTARHAQTSPVRSGSDRPTVAGRRTTPHPKQSHVRRWHSTFAKTRYIASADRERSGPVIRYSLTVDPIQHAAMWLVSLRPLLLTERPWTELRHHVAPVHALTPRTDVLSLISQLVDRVRPGTRRRPRRGPTPTPGPATSQQAGASAGDRGGCDLQRLSFDCHGSCDARRNTHAYRSVTAFHRYGGSDAPSHLHHSYPSHVACCRDCLRPSPDCYASWRNSSAAWSDRPAAGIDRCAWYRDRNPNRSTC